MKATSIKFYEFGEPQQVLQIENKQVKDPGVGEVLVRMKTRPINPSDLIPIRGPIQIGFLYLPFRDMKELVS